MAQLHDFHFFTLETIVVQTILLLIILWVLNKFLFRPYLAYIDQEAEKRKKLEQEYKRISQLTQDAENEKQVLLQEAKKQAQNIQKQAEEIAKKEANHIKELAILESQTIKNSAYNDIKKEKQNMLQDIQKNVVVLIMKFHEKIFQNEKINKDFIENEIKQLNIK